MATTTKVQTVTSVTFGPCNYGITFFGDRFGVCKNGYGKIKYMPVYCWNFKAGYFPFLMKTKISGRDTAEELHDNIFLCAKLKTCMSECVALCEHVLKYGHGAR